MRDAVARRRLVDDGDRVMVAVSGGPDSVALLHLLLRLAEERALSLHAFHMDHGLRPDSAEDAAFVRRLAERWGVPLTSARADVRAERRRGESIQQAARRVRYAAMRRAAEEAGARRIALGHHADDQAETVLMRFLRGAGAGGLAGMRWRRGQFIRPLLAVSRPQIEAYCAAFGLETRQDPSNTNTEYLRNKIRLGLLPLLQAEYNPGVRTALNRAAALLRDDDDFLEYLAYRAFRRMSAAEPASAPDASAPARGEARSFVGRDVDGARCAGGDAAHSAAGNVRRAADGDGSRLTGGDVPRSGGSGPSGDRSVTDRDIGPEIDVERWADDQDLVAEPEHGGAVSLPVEELRRQPRSLRRRVVRFAARHAGGAPASLTYDHVEAVLALLDEEPSGAAELPGGVRVRRRGGRLEFEPRAVRDEERDEAFETELAVPGRTAVPGNKVVEASLIDRPPEGVRPGPDEAWLDRDRLSPPVVVRTWRPGDRMRPLGLGGTKKLQDLFVDAKIPATARRRLPVIADARGVVWVAGRVDERAAVGPGTRRVLRLRIESL